MPGRRWTEEQKAEASKRMKRRWRDPGYRAVQSARLGALMQDPQNRAAASARMKKLNVRIALDEDLKRKQVRGDRKSVV